jgi:predicted ArsR family transcriptional regulator
VDNEDLAAQLAGLAALDEPVRRALYFFVAEQGREVSRDEAAQAAGVSRNLAGFHLDRLAAEGLLATSYRRLTGRSGPGAGRPAKLYRRSDRQLEVSVPARRYELAARLLAAAVDGAGDGNVRATLAEAARGMGAQIGEAAAPATPGPAASGGAPPTPRSRLLAALTAVGYSPEQDEAELRLRNCPFHALVGEHKELVCGMNLALLQGVVSGLGAVDARPVLAPRPGLCCVRIDLGE